MGETMGSSGGDGLTVSLFRTAAAKDRHARVTAEMLGAVLTAVEECRVRLESEGKGPVCFSNVVSALVSACGQVDLQAQAELARRGQPPSSETARTLRAAADLIESGRWRAFCAGEVPS